MGMSVEGLEDLEDYLDGFSPLSLVVVRRGKIVWEKYWERNNKDTKFEWNSATKSVVSALTGMAAEQGFLGLDQPAHEILDMWKPPDPRSGITVRHLLSMTSGLDWSWAEYFSIVAGLVPGLGQFPLVSQSLSLKLKHTPGTHWTYNNTALMVMSRVFRNAVGSSISEFGQKDLFGPLGMHSPQWITDSAGHTCPFMGLQATARDMARFGYLFLRKGAWNGQQIVPEAWVEASTQAGASGVYSAYGHLWWVNGHETFWMPKEGQPIYTWPKGGYFFGDDAGPDAYGALGFMGQLVLVIPSKELVMVRNGSTEGYSYQEIFTLLARAVLSD